MRPEQPGNEAGGLGDEAGGLGNEDMAAWE